MQTYTKQLLALFKGIGIKEESLSAMLACLGGHLKTYEKGIR
jgi:hypothetical protein